ncbi:MAG: 30S ribosomal protein S8e [Candidatus Bathyarchaeota archaeon]|nr:MAG: 30S ribosomal protein S8e [Candidatus Bathyarchaeota archaeon]
MSVWHGSSHKKKLSGGRKRIKRKKRRFERGSFPAETTLGERKIKIARRRGGNPKIRAFSELQVCVSNPATGKTEKLEIMRVIRNPANVDYDRRGVITKGTIIDTKLGHARVTSRPGQHGLINAILVSKERKG